MKILVVSIKTEKWLTRSLSIFKPEKTLVIGFMILRFLYD